MQRNQGYQRPREELHYKEGTKLDTVVHHQQCVEFKFFKCINVFNSNRAFIQPFHCQIPQTDAKADDID